MDDEERDPRADSAFHQFDEIEETDLDMIHLQSPRRPVVANPTQTFVHLLDATLGQLNFFTLWRFAAVALPMSIRWTTGTLTALNFLVPYFLCLVFLAWPVYVFETGIAQTTGGENNRAMASLSLKSRVSALNWLLSLFFLMFCASIASYSFIFAWEASGHWANYSSPGLKAADALDIYVGRECTRYSDYVPHISPWLCGPKGQRLDVSCYDETQCHLWAGNGRCLSVPWAPASEYLFTSKEEYDPEMDQDYPHYCAGRYLHDVTTNDARAVINANGYWRDWGGKMRPRLPVSYFLVFVGAGGLTMLTALGYKGSQLGVICKVTAAVIRICIGLYGFIVLGALTIAAMNWWSEAPSYAFDWNQGLTQFEWKSFVHPDIWAFALIQAFLTLRVCTGQNELAASRNPTPTKNIVLQCGVGAFMQTFMCMLAFYLCWFAYGATAATSFSGESESTYSNIRFDIRNSPYGTLFTSVQSMLDNGPKLDGSTPHSKAWGQAFWIGMGLLGINGVHHCIDTVVGAFSLSSINWKWGFPRYAWAGVGIILLYLMTIPQWFGSSWGLTITYHHFLTNWAYPAMLVYEGVSIGWMVGHDLRVKHYGKVFTYLQVSCYIGGSLIAAFCVAATWRYSPIYAPLVGLGVGLLCMVLSFILPFPFMRSHDAYGRKHNSVDAVRMVIFGSCDHVRKELNLRCNHSYRLFRMSPLSTLAVRYGLTSCALLTFANMSSYIKNIWHFSPYTPFNFSYVDQFMVVQTLMEKYDLVRAPGWVVGVAAWYALSFVVVPPFGYVKPEWLDWIVPYNVDENFFEVKEAVERFADTRNAVSEVRVAYQEQTEPIIGSSVKASRSMVPSSLIPASQQVRLDPVDDFEPDGVSNTADYLTYLTNNR